jgi:FkbM family methyltransferase
VRPIRTRLRPVIRRFRAALRSPAPRPLHVDEMQALLVELRGRGLDCRSILDVGAYLGDWSRLAKRVFPSARCFLIEPQVEMRRSLEAFCAEYPDSRWFLAGAGPAAGELTLTHWGDVSGASFLPEASPEPLPPVQQRRVSVVTIDSLLEEGSIAMPELVKLDVQGFEIEALRGGQRLFGNVEAFILETSLFRFIPGMPIFHEVVAFMAERDYLAYDLGGLLRRPYDRALGQVDVCFARRRGALRASDRWS